MTTTLTSKKVQQANREQTALPPADIAQLSAVGELLKDEHARLIDEKGNTVNLPKEVYGILLQVVEAMKAGRAIHLIPMMTTLTTGEAASFLGVSRPTLVKLLEEKKIPYHKPNRHRYVYLTDLIDYKEQTKHQARSILTELSKTAVADNLHKVSMNAVDEALRSVRKG